MMDCEQARRELGGGASGSALARSALTAHLAGCAACRQVAAEERELTRLLDQLPMHPAPAGLKRRLADRLPALSPPRTVGLRARVGLAVAVALCAVLAAFWLGRHRGAAQPSGPGAGGGVLESGPGVASATDALVHEAVNDHLRRLFSEHPLEVASGGPHQVKPWFVGKLDFAPALEFWGDDEFVLEGGAVAYFVDRKCASVVFRRRLHTITLFVLPGAGLGWPSRRVPGHSRGFNSLLWTAGEQSYALVSDLDPTELATLSSKLSP